MIKYFLLILLASLLFSACAPQSNSLGGSWILAAYGPQGSTTPAVADGQAAITFNEDGSLNGKSGCNSFGGEFKLDGDQISFNGLVSTLIACEEPLMSQEGAMFKVLNGTATHRIDGDTLTITNNGSELVFTRANGQ